MYKGGNANWLDLARLIFATSVVFLHIFHLVPLAKDSSFLGYTSVVGALGVPAFFAVSGFLIFLSYDKSESLFSYFIARFFRLYPAYIVVILVSTCAGAFMTNVPIGESIDYLVWNLVFLNFMSPEIGGLFNQNILNVFNGALWSLKVEVMFYATVPFIILCVKRYGPLMIPFFYLLGKFTQFFTPEFAGMIGIESQVFANQLPNQLPYFISGLILYRYYETIFRYSIFIAPASLIIYLSDVWILNELAFTTVLIWSFVKLAGSRLSLPFGDLSYGVYIIHFPIIQTMVYFDIHDKMILEAFIAMILVTVFFSSMLLNKLIEKPFIRFGRKISSSDPFRRNH
jgi:peptidoglycan/LPS O-acetylase OafA/YrhL